VRSSDGTRLLRLGGGLGHGLGLLLEHLRDGPRTLDRELPVGQLRSTELRRRRASRGGAV
jgi:hypothetical protein